MKVKLKDVCLQFLVPMRDRPKVFDGNIPWCRIEDIEGRFFNKSLSGLAVSQKVIDEMHLVVFPVGTVICSCSATLGAYAINTRPLITNQTFIGIVCDENKIYNKYLYYYMKLMTKKLEYISIGSTIPYIPRESFENLEIDLPKIDIQHKIADKLWNIDSKIENNNKINSELESMAKTLYDYWFLQYEFPNEEGKPYKSSGGKLVYNEELKREIPEGWKVKHTFEIAEIKTGKEDANHSTINGKYPFFTCSNDILKCDDYKFDCNAILIAGNGDFNVKHYKGKFNAYQRTYVIIPFEEKCVGLFNMCCRQKIDKFKKGSNGSIVKFITLGDIQNIQMFTGFSDKLLKPFNKYLEIFDSLKKQNQELSSFRDFLLPLLINGQVTFKTNNDK